jgi:hypothetical protein
MKFFLLFTVCLVFASCSIPQVEDAKCTASRETVRSFYAQHFSEGDKIGFTRDNITREEKFFTPEFYKLLLNEISRQEDFLKANPNETPFLTGDPFSDSPEYAVGFKVGECKVSGENNVTHNVRLFWKIADKPTVGDIKIDAEKRGDQWLIGDFTGDKDGSLAKILGREKYK